MNSIITSQNRKRHQRRINKYYRRLTQLVNEVPEWNGRLVIKQVRSHFISEEDWGSLAVVYYLYDKKTQHHEYHRINWFSCFTFAKMCGELNDFINICEEIERSQGENV